jgi:Asp-tRNA(Asn)/Glu-tRNA(Gln) amidotransferase A subunit family amidase
MRTLEKKSKWVILATLVVVLRIIAPIASAQKPTAQKFHLEEATIASTQRAIKTKQITTAQLVHLYLNRIKAYNGVCVDQPDGPLGFITPIPHAGQINALMTLNLRPATRVALGFDDHHARSMTDSVDNDPSMPDALEVAAVLDSKFAKTGQLAGPLHGAILAIKDQYDTFDMRTTAGQDAFFANDRPPDDATFVKRLRDAGAIILAKANLGEGGSSRSRSSFGGTMCNPYDTTRTPGFSSGGSGSSVAANLVTCAIGEETGGSILGPARTGDEVGLAPTQELVSQDGMEGKGFNHRVGPICRTVEDAARVLDVISGYDPKDELTALSVGRKPSREYVSFAGEKRLDGIRIGVVREFMDKDLFTQASFQTIDLADQAINDLRGLGATIVDPGPHGALFQDCVNKYVPLYRNKLFTAQLSDHFSSGADSISTLVSMFENPSAVHNGPNIRNLGPTGAVGGGNSGEGKFFLDMYLKERGDANIKSTTDLINKANFFTDVRPYSDFTSYKEQLQNTNSASTLDLANVFQNRIAYQVIVMQCMAMQNLDAVTFASGVSVAAILGAPMEPAKNNSPLQTWGVLGANGFPAINVPAGFTTEVFDRVRDASAPGGTRLVGPVQAKMPVGINFLTRPFDEPTLLRIASAYEAATHHRIPPPDFGPLPSEP